MSKIKILFFEPFSGISGDMALGAMLDLGIDQSEFLKRLYLLGLDEYTISIKKGVNGGISGTKVDIKPFVSYADNIEAGHSDHFHHTHSTPNSENHEHHESKVQHKIESHFHRSYKDIKEIIEKSSISEVAKKFSIAVFEKLAEAEGKIHGVPIEEVTFHEVGAVDSIVDIVGFAICLDMIGLDRIFVSSVNVGGGMVKSRHGLLPVPAPATLELLKDIPIHSKGLHGEMTTPTGAAILAAFGDYSSVFPSMSVEKIGYGLGSRNYDFPNCLRVTLGAADTKDIKEEKIRIIESNIDDMGGEFFGFLMEKLFAHNALDVWFTPIYMKKSRPAVKLSILCKESCAKKLSEIVLNETTTIGLRSYSVERTILDREIFKVETQFGAVTVKVSKGSGVSEKIAPEYEDCKKLALINDVPLRAVYDAALDEYRKK